MLLRGTNLHLEYTNSDCLQTWVADSPMSYHRTHNTWASQQPPILVGDRFAQNGPKMVPKGGLFRVWVMEGMVKGLKDDQKGFLCIFPCFCF